MTGSRPSALSGLIDEDPKPILSAICDSKASMPISCLFKADMGIVKSLPCEKVFLEEQVDFERDYPMMINPVNWRPASHFGPRKGGDLDLSFSCFILF